MRSNSQPSFLMAHKRQSIATRCHRRRMQPLSICSKVKLKPRPMKASLIQQGPSPRITNALCHAETSTLKKARLTLRATSLTTSCLPTRAKHKMQFCTCALDNLPFLFWHYSKTIRYMPSDNKCNVSLYFLATNN